MEEERAAALFGQGLFPTLSNPGIAVVVAAALADVVDHRRAIAWLIIMVAVNLARSALWGVHKVRPALLSARRWLLAFTAGGTLNGLAWGAMALLLWPPDASHRALLGFVAGGMVASSTAVVPAYLPAFYTFAAATLVPLMVRLFIEGGRVNLAMALLLGTFGLAMLKLSRRAGRWFEQNTELRLGNAQLVERLSQARDHLELRVKERTALLEQTVDRLREAEALTQQALRDRDDFLAVASHELRTPIATLELHLSRLAWELEQPSGHTRAPDSLPGIPIMHRQLRRLTALVDTVLTASGVAREPLHDPDARTDLPAVVRSVVGDLTTHARGAPDITLSLQEPLVGRWDAGRLEQIVSNLVSNAIKYGAGTQVTVKVQSEAQQVVLTVADHGPGIAASDRPRIFDRFYRADVGNHTGGLGLGLAVVREIVEAMGGGVGVESEPGQGATFTVKLPLAS